jgi:hypothetical protein
VAADDEDCLVGLFGEEERARECGGLRVVVAGDHRSLALGLDHHVDVAGRAGRPR